MNETEPTNPEPLFCYNHPQRETVLRCNRCERPICNECAVPTPTGYRCKECVRSRQKIFETARTLDYFLAGIIALILGFAGSLLVSIIGFFSIFLGPGVGALAAEIVRRVVQRRRSMLLFRVAAGCALLGCLPVIFLSLLGGGFLGLLWPVVYTFMMVSSFYYRLSGIQIGR